MSKVKNLDELKEIIKNLKQQNKTIVTTNGTFDILHIGHLRMLKQAKALGDYLIVLINSDSSVKKKSGR